MNYEGKKVVVTGGTTGMGFAIAKAVVAGGGEVLVTGMTEKNLEAARRELGMRAHAVRSDTSSIADIDALAKTVKDKLGAIDAVFINAGYATLTPFADATEAVYDATFGVNAKGAFFTAHRLVPLVRDGGALVFTTSVANELGGPGMSIYSGAKAAVRGFVRGIASELLGRNIRVNSVSPGFVRTPTMGVSNATDAERDAFAKEGDHLTPMKRNGTPEEIARAALFLAFEATFTTGFELVADGGLSQL